MQNEKKYLNGGLSADAADWAVEPNCYVNMENARYGSTFFAQGSVGGIESIGSTELISSAQPSMQNYFLGGAYDEAGDRLVWCNWSSIGAHQIKIYDIGTNTTYIALYNTQVTGGLGFDKYHFIHSCHIENGCFYWTDNLNPPRRFQIDAAIKMNYPSYVTNAVAYTSPLSQAVIAWIRRPPGLPPAQEKVTQTSPALVNNFIRYEAFEFCYRYQFRTFEYSTLSDLSTLANYNQEVETFNRIDITIPLGEQIEQDVLQVDLVTRYLVSGKYAVIKSWNKNVAADAAAIAAHNAGSSALTYAFYNSQLGIFLDDAYAAKPYDSVPIRAGTDEFARNRSFMGKYVIGYNTPMITSLQASLEVIFSSDRPFKSNASYQISISFYDNYQRKTGYLTNDSCIVNIPDRSYASAITISYINWALSNINALAEIPIEAYYYSINITKCLRTRFFVQLRGLDAAYATKDANGIYTFTTYSYNPTLSGTAFDISTLVSVNMGYVFSEGDIVKIYIGSSVYSLTVNGQQGNWIIVELQNLGTLNAATNYLFEIYTPYKASTDEPSYEVAQIFKINNPGTNSRTYSTTSGRIRGDIYLLDRKGVNNVYYQISGTVHGAQGFTVQCDYVSQDAVDTSFTTGSSPGTNLAGFNIATNTDRAIITAGASDIVLKIRGNITVTSNQDRVFRTYVEDNSSNITGLVPDTAIVNGVSKTFTVDANVTLTAGSRLFILSFLDDFNPFTSIAFATTSLVIEVVSSAVIYTVEAMSPNDKFYKNWFTDAGRPNFIDTIGQTNKLGGIAYSNTIIEGSKSNGLSTYDALDTVDLDFQMGSLQKLQLTSKVQEQGSVMLAICTKETASLYLSEVQVVGSSSNAFLASAPNVIGTINIMKGSFGTMNPESVLEYKGTVLWIDVNNGKAIQYSENGLFPISSYKINKFWKLFSEAYKSLTPQQIEAFGSRPFVFTGIDPNSGEVLFSVPKVLANPPKGYLPDYPNMPYPFDLWDGRAKSIVFNLYAEPNNWGGAFDITAEGFVYAGNVLYSFKDGGFYRHGKETAPFCNFYGVQYKSRIMFLANSLSNKPKVLNNISLEANKTPSLTYFRTETPNIQASDLMDFDWQVLEGQQYTAVYNDKLTPSATGLKPNALITGDKLRSIVLMVLMEFDVTQTLLEFRFATVGFSISLGHTT